MLFSGLVSVKAGKREDSYGINTVLNWTGNFVTFWLDDLWALWKLHVETLPPEVHYTRGVPLYPGCLFAPASTYGQPIIKFQLPWAEIARPWRQPFWWSHIDLVFHMFYGSFFRNTEVSLSPANPERGDLSHCQNLLSLPFYCTLVFLAESHHLWKHCCHGFFRCEGSNGHLCIPTAGYITQCSRNLLEVH